MALTKVAITSGCQFFRTSAVSRISFLNFAHPRGILEWNKINKQLQVCINMEYRRLRFYRTLKNIAWLNSAIFFIDFLGRIGKGKGKANHAPQESIRECSSSSSRPWARKWRTTDVRYAWPVRLRLPSQPQGITTHWLVPNYTAWRQRHTCVNNLPRVALDSGAAGVRTRDLLIASPAPYRYATEPHMSDMVDEKISGTNFSWVWCLPLEFMISGETVKTHNFGVRFPSVLLICNETFPYRKTAVFGSNSAHVRNIRNLSRQLNPLSNVYLFASETTEIRCT